MTRALLVTDDQARAFTRDARVVAIRWDLVQWALVLDLDAPDAAEGNAVPLRRVWLVFEGVSDISWNMDRARLPNGCWLNSEIVPVPVDGDVEFRISALTPQFGPDERVQGRPTQTVAIRAQALHAVRSEAGTLVRDRDLSRAERIQLASDEEMLAALAGSTD
jgi:hypothetical protein